MVEQTNESNQGSFWTRLKGCCLFFVALIGGATLLGAYLTFGGDFNSDDKPKADTSATATANPSDNVEKPDNAEKPKETPTVSPSSIPSEGDYLPLSGIQSGTCTGVEGGVSCAIEVEVDSDLGLAKVDGGGYLVVECDTKKCVSRKGTPSDLPCVEQELSVFCAQGVGDRGAFYTGLLSFAQGCAEDGKDIICKKSGGVIPTEAGLQRNRVPIVVTRLPESSNYTIGVYAASPWSEARVANCYPTGGKLRCTS